MSSEALAVLGGRFDPYHNAHHTIVSGAREALPISRLLVAPTRNPAHKPVVEPCSVRLELVKLACRDVEGVEVAVLDSPDEASYTWDALANLPPHAGAPLLIVGGDAFAHIDTWKNWRSLFDRVNWVVIPRPQTADWKPAAGEARELAEERTVQSVDELSRGSGKVWLWRFDVPSIAAQDLRSAIGSSDDSWRAMVPERVAQSIVEQGLYRADRRQN